MSADSGYGVAQLRGNYSPGNALDLIWLAGNLALGAAAAHPTMRLLGQRARQHPVGIGPVRFAALAVAALVAPALFFVAYHRGVLRDIPVLAVGCAVLTTLTILRMAGMVADQHRLATTDGLTGLRTRRFAETQLSLETARARRSGGQLGVFVIDIDRFKTINDRYGHPCGDRALIEIASRLRTASRPGDVLARYGGEEFALLVPGATHHELLAVAERVRLQVASRPVSICDQVRVPVTVSVGAASFPANGSTPDELIAVADRALYRAKTGGRNASVIGAPGEAGRDAHAIGVHDGPLIEFLQQMADEVDAWLSPHEHSTAISRWAGEISTEMGHDTRTVRGLELAGRLHDVGKIVIPERILTKPDVLTDEEWSLLRGHPDHGAQLTRLIPGFASVSEIIRQHHERFDGTGYPDRLGGMGIRVEARIIAVCDSWAAMRCDRAYQAALSEDQAREELHRGRGSQFDPDVVDLFLRLHDAARVGDLRRLGALPLSRSTIPGTASPGTASPGITNPGITNPGTANPGTANPGVTNPGAMASPPTMSRVPTQFVPAGQPVTAKVFQNDAS
jgi:diguanylate cyclase (GGDEF)-like protein